jgi:hypothetical protein
MQTTVPLLGSWPAAAATSSSVGYVVKLSMALQVVMCFMASERTGGGGVGCNI